ncbi:MAG: glycosyltransferase [Betaproteobacteria bacterium]|nr:glycosyltransferase [Betaproteobacteria bacterium]MDH4326263.1 glycosyltransferase [Betaproteobacteria bacterium]
MLSVVVNFFNNRREARNTLYSLTAGYQRGADQLEYEVIAVDNGSREPLTEADVRACGPQFRYHYVKDAKVSPATAINAACRDAAGEHLLVVIDGAHILSPRVLSLASLAFQSLPSPFIATVPFHLGPKHQYDSVLEGYNQEVEDGVLAACGWREDGYRLYSASAAFADASEGWFGMLLESGCFALRKVDFIALGGYEERFQTRGGGLVNLDFFRRALLRPALQYVVLLGEGTFHQFHGGVTTNQPRDRQPWSEFHEEYLRIRHEPYRLVPREPIFIGTVPAEARRIAQYSAGRGFELWEKPRT